MQIPLLKPDPLVPLPVDSRHYVAAVQSQTGERDALRNASAETWDRMTPLVHFVGPRSTAGPFKAQRIRNWVAKLASAVGSHATYLDVMRLDPVHPVDTRDGTVAVLKYLYAESRARGMRFVPVAHVGESTEVHRTIVSDAVLEDGYGIALRYRLRTCMPPVGTRLADWLTTELATLRQEVSNADLLVDLEYIDSDDDIDADGIAASLRQMLAVGPWRSVVLLGSSIPKMMSSIDQGTIGALPRKEWELWSQLHQCDLSRIPTFGDYAVQHPRPPNSGGGGANMRANIRYTANGETLVARGEGAVREEGKEQYRVLCQQLVSRTEFAGRSYSWGDALINDCARGEVEPGAQNMWRGAGTSHHLEAVTEQLADSGS